MTAPVSSSSQLSQQQAVPLSEEPPATETKVKMVLVSFGRGAWPPNPSRPPQRNSGD